MNIIIKFIVPKWKSSTELYYNAECRLWDGCAGRSGKQPGMVWYICQIACAWVVAGAGSISSQCIVGMLDMDIDILLWKCFEKWIA